MDALDLDVVQRRGRQRDARALLRFLARASAKSGCMLPMVTAFSGIDASGG